MKDFDSFYVTWYSRAKNFAREYIRDEAEAENIVQDVFLKLYQRKEMLDSDYSPVSYLFVSVKNGCLNYLRHKLVKEVALSKLDEEERLDGRIRYAALRQMDVSFGDVKEVERVLGEAIDSLPEKCRKIFYMSRFDGIKQKDIAAILGISVNTVESQMAIAYRKLKEYLLLLR
ncbi:MAG: RNA polymerase sigma-70 factor [Firmicutes bacterium]|nr:RNA polymerase sigma-70 factor [Bacillota bacterium]